MEWQRFMPFCFILTSGLLAKVQWTRRSASLQFNRKTAFCMNGGTRSVASEFVRVLKVAHLYSEYILHLCPRESYNGGEVAVNPLNNGCGERVLNGVGTSPGEGAG